jgi:lysophospholipase L1-like esterase
MKKSVFLPVALVLATVASPTLAQNATQPDKSFFFRDGDRAVLLGDSITQQRLYSTFVESYTLSRFPNWKITFRNTGWNGDRANFAMRGGQESGLKRDIYPLNPTAIMVAFGMNDARSGENGRQTYIDTSRSLTTALQNAGARVALISSSPEEKYEAGQPAGSAYNTLLRAYTEGLKEVAVEKNALFVDQLNPMIATIEQGRASGVLAKQAGGPRFVPDTVHGNFPGHLVMATHILKGLNAPSLVSSVEIDAKSNKAKAQNATVNQITSNDGTLQLNRLDTALPWPIHSETKLALEIPGFTPIDDLSRYELKVTNLTKPSYEVAIDGQTVGTYTKEQLAAGVNFSQNAGPISKQGQDLLKKIMDKNHVFHERWRNVQIFTFPKWAGDNEAERAAELARLDAQILALEGEINELRKPKPHVWTIKPVG